MHSDLRRVSAHLRGQVQGTAIAHLQICVPDPIEELLTVTLDGAAVLPEEIAVAGQGRVHCLRLGPGELAVSYDAVSGPTSIRPTVTAEDEIVYRRPSRYAESDRLGAVATAEFLGGPGGWAQHRSPADLLVAVSSWVGTRLSYIPGSSRPTDGAVETLLQRAGVCRDYAHLVVALLRALDVPARLSAVYAPGLDPMDFHAVAEVAIGGIWYVVDATTLAPRSSLVRISSGRDAADTAFLSTYGAAVELISIEVSATVDGSLPTDDVTALVSLAGNPLRESAA